MFICALKNQLKICTITIYTVLSTYCSGEVFSTWIDLHGFINTQDHWLWHQATLYNFLLVFHSNYVRVLYRFSLCSQKLAKTANFSYTSDVVKDHIEDCPIVISPRYFVSEKKQNENYQLMEKVSWNVGILRECDRQTDIQTDRRQLCVCLSVCLSVYHTHVKYQHFNFQLCSKVAQQCGCCLRLFIDNNNLVLWLLRIP